MNGMKGIIDVSGSELFAAAAKALLGAGVGRAIADDGARAALWLHDMGYDGTASILEAADGTTSAKTLGVSHVDLLVSHATTEANIADLDSPLLFVGLLGLAARQHGLRFTLGAEADLRAIAITPTFVFGPVDELTTPLTVECSPTAEPHNISTALPARVEVTATAWQRVNEAAARIYVPSNERSRATGAGAGLIDVD